MEYTISSFLRDFSSIRKQTFQSHTIKNSFMDSEMFRVAFKKALKKMCYYNNKTPTNRVFEEPISLYLFQLSEGFYNGQKELKSTLQSHSFRSKHTSIFKLKFLYKNYAKENIQVAVNNAKAGLSCHGIDARKAEKERKKQIRNIEAVGGIVSAELLIPILDLEKNLTSEDLELLQSLLDLLQALLLLEPASTRRPIDGCNSRSDSEDLACESDSDSSCILYDSIVQNADFVALD
ncbi:hypothetical protein L873DRAFT_1786114 [Choiromyces venosus 120613-1]|uniref:Uncharacterized protein n=1 Tax=Choiromyces venosus 120613-1 TaxID=1336337 RepID=A0A3N4K1U1_9PEZI|nr:hypothetical protein L873DRAFT_1786114 [Choiromyces venosus 120613-1]